MPFVGDTIIRVSFSLGQKNGDRTWEIQPEISQYTVIQTGKSRRSIQYVDVDGHVSHITLEKNDKEK